MWWSKCVFRLREVGLLSSQRCFRPPVEARSLFDRVPVHSWVTRKCKRLILPVLATKSNQDGARAKRRPCDTRESSDRLLHRLVEAGRDCGDTDVMQNIIGLTRLWDFLRDHFGFRDTRGFLLSVVKERRFVGHGRESVVMSWMQFLLALGLTRGELEQVVLKFPKVLTCTVELTAPKVEFLRTVGMQDTDIIALVKVLPELLCYGLDSNIRPVVEYLKSFGLNHKDIKKSLMRYPQLVRLSIESNIKPKVQFFLSHGATKEAAAQIIKRVPSVLGLSLEKNIEPKYNFVTKVLGKSVEEIFLCPTYFSLSFEKRILFRVGVLDFMGYDFCKPAIRTLFLMADKDFKKEYGALEVELFKGWWDTLDKEQKAECVRNQIYLFHAKE